MSKSACSTATKSENRLVTARAGPPAWTPHRSRPARLRRSVIRSELPRMRWIPNVWYLTATIHLPVQCRTSRSPFERPCPIRAHDTHARGGPNVTTDRPSQRELHRREMVGGTQRAHRRRRRPATGRHLRRPGTPTPMTSTRAVRAAADAFRTWGRTTPAERAATAAEAGRPARGPPGRPGRGRVRQRRQAGGRHRHRDRGVGGLPALLRRGLPHHGDPGAPASTWRATPRCCAGSRSASSASIAPWNYPLHDGDLEGRPGAGRRQHRGAQAVGADAAVVAAAGRASPPTCSRPVCSTCWPAARRPAPRWWRTRWWR